MDGGKQERKLDISICFEDIQKTDMLFQHSGDFVVVTGGGVLVVVTGGLLVVLGGLDIDGVEVVDGG